MESVELAKLKAMSMASMRSCSLETEKKIVRYLSNVNSSRKNICKFTGLARTTVFDSLMRLQHRGVVDCYMLNNGKRGRPRTIWYCVI